jgi:putative DNA primase/helicase
MANSDLFLSKQSEGISNDRAALVGVRFLTVSETDEGRKLNESLVKGLTGGDTQMVRFLRQEFFPMTPKLTPFMFTNHKPIITGTDNGIWRRVKLVPWLHNFETDPEREDKKDVYSKMRAELSGILTWMYKGYRARVEAGKLVIPDVVQNDTAEYRQQSDTLGEFLEDYCVTDEENATVTIDDLYKKYREFASSAGISDNYTLTKKGLTGKLKERSDIPFLKPDRKAGVRFWIGIRLLNDGEEPHARNKKEEPTPEQSQPEEPPTQKPLGVPTADQIANWPDDAYQYAGEPRSYPCMKHPDGRWVPYCTEQIDGPKWFYACDGCHPEVVASKGAKYN